MTAKERIQQSQARAAQKLAEIERQALLDVERYLDRRDLERLEIDREILDFAGRQEVTSRRTIHRRDRSDDSA